MRFFDIPNAPLANHLTKFLNYHAIKKISHTCQKGRNIFLPAALCYDTQDEQLRREIANHLSFVIICSEMIFDKAELRETVYKKLKQTIHQFNTSIHLRVLRYILLLVLTKQYHMASSIDVNNYERRLMQQLRIMPPSLAKILVSLYSYKFNLNIDHGNTPDFNNQYYSTAPRFEILYRQFTLNQKGSDLIQETVNKLIERFERGGHTFRNNGETLKRLKLILAINNAAVYQINYDKLLDHMEDKTNIVDIVHIVLICESLNQSSIYSLYKLYTHLLKKLVILGFSISADNSQATDFKEVSHIILERASKIIPFLDKNQRFDLQFVIAGLSVCELIDDAIMNFLITHFDFNCFKDQAFFDKIVNINTSSNEVERFCLFAIKKLYPTFVPLSISFIIDWRINEISVIDSSLNQPLILMNKNNLSAHQINMIFDRIKQQIEINNTHDIEEVMWAHTQCVTPSWNVIIRTNISLKALFQCLSIIEEGLDQGQCLEIVTIIVQIAYDTYFSESIENKDPLIHRIMSKLCSRISTNDKLKLIMTIIQKTRGKSYHQKDPLSKASLNCIAYLFDRSTIALFDSFIMGIMDILQIIGYINFDNVSLLNLYYLINPLVSSIKSSIKDKAYDGYLSENYARAIFVLEKEVPVDDRETLACFVDYLKEYILYTGRNDDNMLLKCFQIIRKHTDEGALLRCIFDFLSKSTSRYAFINQNIRVIMGGDNKIPTPWVDFLISKIYSNSPKEFEAALDAICELLLSNFIPMSDELLITVEVAITKYFNQSSRKIQNENIMIILARYYPIKKFVYWFRTLLAEDSYNGIPSTAVYKNRFQFEHVVINICLPFSDLMVLLTSHDDNISYFGYYYLLKKKPNLSIQECSILFEHILFMLNIEKSIPVYIITIITNYQKPIHYKLTGEILNKLLFSTFKNQKSVLIEERNFCGLVNSLLEIFDQNTVSSVLDLISCYVKNKNTSENKNVDHLSDLTELCPADDYISDDFSSQRLTI